MIKHYIKNYYRCKVFSKYVPVAQLDRASDSDSEGRKFESCRAYQKNPTPQGVGFSAVYVNLRASGAKHIEAGFACRMLPQAD